MPQMRKILSRILFVVLLLGCAIWGTIAQTGEFKPDISRALFHTRLDEAQLYLSAADGKRDKMLTPYQDEEINLHLTYNAFNRVDDWQEAIEKDGALGHQEKIGLLRGMAELLRGFTDLARTSGKEVQPVQWHHLPLVLDAFEQGIQLNRMNEALTNAVAPLPYKAALLISNSIVFANNPRADVTRQYLLLKYLQENPAQTLPMLAQPPNYTYPYADSLIIVSAYQSPEQLLTYCQAKGTPLAAKIKTVDHPLVKLISELSRDNQGQLYMPFLYQITLGSITREEVNIAVRDSAKYYSLLVKTAVDNAGLAKNGEKVPSAGMAGDMLKRKSMEVYVNQINGLHDYPAPVRFKCIQGLTPRELYYLIVMNETEIYTSSYMYVYSRIFELMTVKSSDSLLKMVNYDRYKKFLTMSSNYNTLDNFLGRMSIESATALMTDFVDNLEKGNGDDDIEDAVDVANAYAAIRDSAVRKLMKDRVGVNFENALAQNNRKAITIYHLEKLIMESSDNGESVNLTDSLGILPIYTVKNDYLRDTAGRIVMQMYFYGDGAGKGSFNTLMGLMGDRNQWKMTATPEWVQWTSINSQVPFVLFANRALDEEKDLDEEAQRSLIDWMGKNGYNPTLTVHRGHSYYLKYTIEKMLPSSKVVVLGSCGAYHNLADVLKISPDAYIIASKQVGYGVINVQLFMYLINELKRGRDVAWPTMMNDVSKNVGQGMKTDFEDYIFPHQNLGAIFIKAYRRAMSQEQGG